jgi:hypothetical protein
MSAVDPAEMFAFQLHSKADGKMRGDWVDPDGCRAAYSPPSMLSVAMK